MKDEPKLKPQLKLVALNYCGKCGGNAEKSAIAAGYSKAYARGNAYKLVARRDVQEYIKWLNENRSHCRDIMEVEEIQAWWSNVIRNKNIDMKERIRASENLAKSLGAFQNEW